MCKLENICKNMETKFYAAAPIFMYQLIIIKSEWRILEYLGNNVREEQIREGIL